MISQTLLLHSRNLEHFMEHEGSSSYLQKPATKIYPDSDESTPPSYFRLFFNIILLSTPIFQPYFSLKCTNQNAARISLLSHMQIQDN